MLVRVWKEVQEVSFESRGGAIFSAQGFGKSLKASEVKKGLQC
ncbi:MAG: hypothetical protein Q8K95_06425 [Nitrosomonas sp.]|nr:hypothetical protein [Nitrosomonas sp.]